jgi:hypothetical protein
VADAHPAGCAESSTAFASSPWMADGHRTKGRALSMDRGTGRSHAERCIRLFGDTQSCLMSASQKPLSPGLRSTTAEIPRTSTLIGTKIGV